MSGIHILINDSHGVYIPQFFAEQFNVEGWEVEKGDLDILIAGPEHDLYWDAWNDVTSYASYQDDDGMKWTLYQDGDLFAICEDRMTAEEYKNFFGEEKEVA